MSNFMIMSDFDGTITVQDTNNSLFDDFIPDKISKIMEKYEQNREKLGVRFILKEGYQNLSLSRKEYKEYVRENIDIEPTFPEFLSFIRTNRIPFAVVSGGFMEGVRTTFDCHNIDIDFPLYANRLLFPEERENQQGPDSGIKIKFMHEKEIADRDFGPVSLAKDIIIENHRQEFSSIAYLGNGRTDIQAIEKADNLLAKAGSFLDRHCSSINVEYHSFSDFREALEIIRNIYSL